jgi:hypothetical protein
LKYSIKRVIKSIAFGILGLTSIIGVNTLATTKASAATSYPIVNGQLVRFELSNGVALNIQTASLANDKPIYSFTGNNSDPEQIFKVISNGDGYNFQRNNTGYSLSASTLSPTNLSPAVAYQSGFGQWQDFWLDDAPGNGYYLIKWRKDPNYCLNVPGSQSNVKITFFQCNTADNDQRFRIVNISSIPYALPMNNNSVGVLEAATGYRVTLPGNNSTPGLNTPNEGDASQKIQFVQVGSQYLLQRAGTNYSLSSNTLDYVTANTAGMAMTTYTTGAGRWQNFGFVDVGSGYFNVKYAWNPNFCLSAGVSTNTGSGFIVPCNPNDNRQRFRTNVVTTSDEFEFWIIAKQTVNGQLIYWNESVDVGHVTTAVVPVKKTFVNGVLNSTIYDTNSTVFKTYSYWPSSQCARVNCINDQNLVKEVIASSKLNGVLASGNNFAMRRLKITPASVGVIDTKSYTSTGCNNYGAGFVYSFCTCVDESTRLWKYVAGEDFTPEGYFGPAAPSSEGSPNIVYRKILDTNASVLSNGYANNVQIKNVQ